MKNLFLLLFSALVFISCHSQNTKDYNFGFESKTGKNGLPDGWFSWGNNTVKAAPAIFHSGKGSVVIQSEQGNHIGGMAYIIINNYKEKEIKLEGYIKTEKVENAAGLFITFGDQQEIQINSKNIKTESVRGTADWKKYTISIVIPKDTDKIMMGGFLKGKGKAWFDDFKFYIDGKNVEEIFLTNQDLYQSADEYFLDSQFRTDSLSPQQINNLCQLGKTWGYLKYQSPEVSKGNINWDYELFRFLPNINSKNFDALLYSWSRSFGAGIQKDIKENYYIDLDPEEGTPSFKNEEIYPRMQWNDDGMKLLALFRYWNMINYFFPYKDIIGKNWDDVLKEYISKIVRTTDELSYKLAMVELIKEINDSHAALSDFGSITEEFLGLNTPPITARYIDNQLAITFIGNQISAYGVEVGDVITEIDHRKVSELTDEKAKYTISSNRSALLRDISFSILRTNEDIMELTLKKSNGKAVTVSLNTVPYETFVEKKNIPISKEFGQNIGYIYPAVITKDEIKTVMKKFMNKKGIIIDLRCYPKEFSTEVISEYFFPDSREFAQFKATSLQHPGKFEVKGYSKIGKSNSSYYKGKVAILVDETTQSASEFLTMALRTAPKSAVIGSQTAGADGDLRKMPLPGGITTAVSGSGIYYPKGKSTQRTGITIDIQAKPTLQSVRNGEDPLIQKAIEFINQ